MATKLAFNSYTIRSKLNNPKEVGSTFKQLRDIGFEAVELDLDSLLLQFDAVDLKGLLNELGLNAFSAHTGFERLENGIENALKSFKILGLEYAVVPTLPNDRFCKDEEGYLSGTRMLASFGKRMKEDGIKFAYHNHAKEFEKFAGKTAMEIVFNESNWEDYLAELDVYWIQNAGGDPEEWLREYRGRMPLVHIKDMGVVSGKPMTMEVGEGNMNMPSIIEACREARVEWYIIEQDYCLRDPVQSLAISKAYLNKLGVS